MNTPKQILTPRTDAVSIEGWKVQYADVVHAHFARELERENAVKQGIIAILENDLATAQRTMDRLTGALRLIAAKQASWSVARTVVIEALKEVA